MRKIIKHVFSMMLVGILLTCMLPIQVLADTEENKIPPKILQYIDYDEEGNIIGQGSVYNAYYAMPKASWPGTDTLGSGVTRQYMSASGFTISKGQSVTVVYFLNQSASTGFAVTNGRTTVRSVNSSAKTVSNTGNATASVSGAYLSITNRGSWDVTISNVSIGWS